MGNLNHKGEFIESLKELSETLKKPEGFSEIRIFANHVIQDGKPVLMMSPKDFEWYKRNSQCAVKGP